MKSQLNNSNNIICIQKQTSFNNPPGFTQFQISKNNQRKNSFGKNNNNNHSYHEIFSLSSRNSNTNTNAIYHDYNNNLGKKLNGNNSTKYISNIKTKFKINPKIYIRNSSLNSVQKPKTHIIPNIIYDRNNNNNVLNTKINSQNLINDNYIYYNKDYKEIDYNMRRNGYNNDNKIKYYKIEKPIKYDNNCNIRYSNTVAYKNSNYNSFQKYSKDGDNIYYIYQESIPDRNNPIIKNDYSDLNYTNQNEI